MIDNYAAFFNCTPVGRASDSMMAPDGGWTVGAGVRGERGREAGGEGKGSGERGGEKRGERGREVGREGEGRGEREGEGSKERGGGKRG